MASPAQERTPTAKKMQNSRLRQPQKSPSAPRMGANRATSNMAMLVQYPQVAMLLAESRVKPATVP